MSVLLVSADLATTSKVQGAAGAAGVPLVVAMSPAAVVDRLSANEVQLVLLDLNSSIVDPAEIMSALGEKREELTVLAFGPHVQTARLEAAQQAGCAAVFPNGQFFSQAATILQHYLQAN